MLSNYQKDVDKNWKRRHLEEAKYREIREQMMTRAKLTELESKKRNRDYELA